MSRLLAGSEGFGYAYVSVRKDIPLEALARVTEAGALRIVIDYYDVTNPPEENEWIYPEELEEILDLDGDDDRGFYEAEHYDTRAKELFEKLIENEVEQHIIPLMEHYGESLEEISLVAATQYRLLQDEWEHMLKYLNGLLPADLQLSMEELRTFDSQCLREYDPELHEAARDDGTLFLQYFLDKEPEGLAYLGFRILVHAIQHDLEVCDIDDEPRWQRSFYPNNDEDDDGDDEEADEGEDDDE